MRPAVNTLVGWIALSALQFLLLASTAATAQDAPDERRPDREAQTSENRWVASFALTSGVFLQAQAGSTISCRFPDPADATGCPAAAYIPIRPPTSSHELGIAAFVGTNLEIMTPAFAVPTRPRLFLSGEFLPTFAAKRDVSGEGDPSCVRGPQQNDPCASQEDPNNPRPIPYGENDANGQGSKVSTDYDLLSFGAKLGVSFPAQIAERRVRIKPSVGWLNYAVKVSGKLIDATCDPPTRCTNSNQGPGSLRETNLTGSDTRRLNAIGPAVDIEVDTGRVGPLGTSLFLGGGAYRTLGDRKVQLVTTQVYPNDGLPLANQAVMATWDAKFDPWIYRVGVGLRIQWLGSAF